ncbi:MAG: phosphatidate cytidylyltransferase [Verrucomicrobiota bacterium]
MAAFTFGKLFGKHPLRSHISPKKTWAGAPARWRYRAAVGVALSFPEFNALQLVLTGLIVGIGGQLGDPRHQRHHDATSASRTWGGHPGTAAFLDRIDSLIIAPLFFHMAGCFRCAR